MSLYSLIFAVLLAIAPSAGFSAVDLEALPEGVLDPLNIDLFGDDIVCEEIVPRLEAYKKMQTDHDTQILSYLTLVSGSVAQWKLALEPLKSGECEQLPEDAFLEMDNMVSETASLLYMARRNSETLNGLLPPMIEVLPACMQAPASAGGPLTCDQLSRSMTDYSERLLAHESSVNDLLGLVVQRLGTMYEVMSQYDCADLQNGTLLVLPDAANKVDTLTTTAYDNAEKLANEFDRISGSFLSCQ